YSIELDSEALSSALPTTDKTADSNDDMMILVVDDHPINRRLLEKISAGGYGDKRLSPKESEVLRLFAEGFLVTEIAKKLNR
ncbi:hypothetical protein L0D00_26210, partial [Salmonella enterica subsp. enterica]|nr:hypothetical protein [Salmonella enterica subsp. enterica]